MHVDDLKIFVRDGSTKKHLHTLIHAKISYIKHYSSKVKIEATLIFKCQSSLQKLLKRQSCLLKRRGGDLSPQVETEIHRFAFGIVIQITLRSNHHYAKLNGINRVCQRKFLIMLFTPKISVDTLECEHEHEY